MEPGTFSSLDSSTVASLADTVLDRYCSHPIRVPGEPGKPGQWVRCGSRLTHRCPSCSKIYRGDWSAILRSGVFNDGTLTPENFTSIKFQFLTLTAPSFGATHRTETLKGVPVRGYDYDGAVQWNYWMSRLWDHTRLRLRRQMPNMAYAVVREWQARGSLHLHVLLRVPAAESQPDGQLERLSQETETVITDAEGSSFTMRWGTQVRCETLQPQGNDAEDTARTLSYLAKALSYSAKSFSESLQTKGHSVHPLYEAHVGRLEHAARRMRCSRCGWLPGYGCTAMAHRQFGARASLVSVSRETADRPGWSLTGLTRQLQKEMRMSWAACHSSSPGMSTENLDAIGWATRTAANIETRASPPEPSATENPDACVATLDRYRQRWKQYEAENNAQKPGPGASIREQLEFIAWVVNRRCLPEDRRGFVLLEDLDAWISGDRSVEHSPPEPLVA